MAVYNHNNNTTNIELSTNFHKYFMLYTRFNIKNNALLNLSI
jgi:hypothetical protein